MHSLVKGVQGKKPSNGKINSENDDFQRSSPELVNINHTWHRLSFGNFVQIKDTQNEIMIIIFLSLNQLDLHKLLRLQPSLRYGYAVHAPLAFCL